MGDRSSVMKMRAVPDENHVPNASLNIECVPFFDHHVFGGLTYLIELFAQGFVVMNMVSIRPGKVV